MPDELSELQENAEHGRENPSLAPISVTMAILAVRCRRFTAGAPRAYRRIAFPESRQRSMGLLPGEKHSPAQL
jgi:hypothetical protein